MSEEIKEVTRYRFAGQDYETREQAEYAIKKADLFEWLQTHNTHAHDLRHLAEAMLDRRNVLARLLGLTPPDEAEAASGRWREVIEFITVAPYLDDDVGFYTVKDVTGWLQEKCPQMSLCT